MDWLKKFVINRALYAMLLLMLCIGIFPFVILYCLTGWIGKSWKKVSPTSKLAEGMERVWDVIGAPYDALVKLVG
jgi:hypothetical protein